MPMGSLRSYTPVGRWLGHGLTIAVAVAWISIQDRKGGNDPRRDVSILMSISIRRTGGRFLGISSTQGETRLLLATWSLGLGYDD